MNSGPNLKDRQASVFRFDLKVYRLSAIKKAVYHFAGEYEAAIELANGEFAEVRLMPRNPVTARPASDLSREVLDQELREIVAEETKGLRDLLLAHTYSELSVTDPLGETGDFHGDPLGIKQRETPRQ